MMTASYQSKSIVFNRQYCEGCRRLSFMKPEMNAKQMCVMVHNLLI